MGFVEVLLGERGKFRRRIFERHVCPYSRGKDGTAIMEAMHRLMKVRTTFIIAHLLSTLDACDPTGDGSRASEGTGRRRYSV
jgi:hypothetical protein